MLIGNPMIFRQLPFEHALAKCVEAGYDALELWPPQISEFCTPALRRELRGYARSLGLDLVRLNCADRPYFQTIRSLEHAKTALAGLIADVDATADLGMTQMLTWEGRSYNCSVDEKFGAVLENTHWMFEQACCHARTRNIELTVEVHPFTLGIDLQWLVALCDRLGDQPFSVTYDCCHFGVGLPEGYLQAVDRLSHRIGHVHFSDSDTLSSEVHFPPGAGCLDLEGIVAALLRNGFNGSMMLDLWLYPLPEQGTSVGVPYVRNVCKILGLP